LFEADGASRTISNGIAYEPELFLFRGTSLLPSKNSSFHDFLLSAPTTDLIADTNNLGFSFLLPTGDTIGMNSVSCIFKF
jgi:hypothetical protein